jgi:hypothetical protein
MFASRWALSTPESLLIFALRPGGIRIRVEVGASD